MSGCEGPKKAVSMYRTDVAYLNQFQIPSRLLLLFLHHSHYISGFSPR